MLHQIGMAVMSTAEAGVKSTGVNRASTGIASRVEPGFGLHVLVFIVSYALIISRRPDALSNPQFFVEDGTIWYAQAYNLGWLHSLTLPYAGYFQTLPRLAAALALLFPFRFAPLVMNVIGIGIQVLPVNIFLSERCANWAQLRERVLYAAVYVALPNTWAIDATITNAQWHLALICCLLVLASPSSKRSWRVFDILIISLSALTGPFCLVLLPIALISRWCRRNFPSAPILANLVAGSLVQSITIYATATTARHDGLLGARVQSFVRILAGQVYLGALLGHNTLALSAGRGLLISVTLLGTIVLVYCFAFSRLELKLYLAFCVSLFAAAMASPQVPADPTKWQALKWSMDAQYWFFPMLGFAWSLIWCLRNAKPQLLRILSATMLFFMCIGIARDWRYSAYPDLKFSEYARALDNARPGTVLSVPVVTRSGASPDWIMHLKKR